MTAFEVLTMGRIGVDLYPLQVGVGAATRSRASASTSAAARPTSPWPRPGTGGARRSSPAPGTTRSATFLHDALRGYGVDDRYVTPVRTCPTPVTFCEIFPPDDFPLYFYRLPKAPDLEIQRRGAGPRRDPRRRGCSG